MFAFSVAARFADPIVSLPPYQFARERFRVSWFVRDDRHGWEAYDSEQGANPKGGISRRPRDSEHHRAPAETCREIGPMMLGFPKCYFGMQKASLGSLPWRVNLVLSAFFIDEILASSVKAGFPPEIQFLSLPRPRRTYRRPGLSRYPWLRKASEFRLYPSS